MDSQKKSQEALKLLNEAEKSLKTGLLKWTPDYDSAADSYNKAAISFRLIKSYDKSMECFLKSVECYKNNKSWFHAAKAYEQIILLMKETGNLARIEETAHKSSELFLQHGSTEAASTILAKSAKIIEKDYPNSALKLYQKAVESTVDEDSAGGTAENASKISRLSVKLKLFDQAMDAILKEIQINQKLNDQGQIGRLVVALVLVQLARTDSVAAEKHFNDLGGYCAKEEQQLLQNLFASIDEGDSDSIVRCLNDPFIKHMDVEYTILARALQEERKATEVSNEDNMNEYL